MALPDSLAKLGANGIDILRARIELFGLDLEDAVWRTVTLFCLSLAATLLIFSASFFAAAAFIFFHWESHPLWAMSVVGTSYFIGGAVLLIILFRWFNTLPFLMRDSIDSLRRDAQVLSSRT